MMANLNLVDVDLKRDIQEISKYVQSYIDSTYLSQMRNQIQTHKRQCRERPFAEVQLLEAVVPFVEREEAKDKIASIIKMITYSKMIENMLPQYGGKNIFRKEEGEENTPQDYIHQAVVILVLYKVIVWAEEHKED